jgi:hypothetical protein
VRSAGWADRQAHRQAQVVGPEIQRAAELSDQGTQRFEAHAAAHQRVKVFGQFHPVVGEVVDEAAAGAAE